MTTSRDVIAKVLWDSSSAAFQSGYDRADLILKALLCAPESVRLELAAQLNPWLAIETAPKDGHFVWLSNGHLIRIGFWEQSSKRWVDFVRSEAREGRTDLLFAPTHWLPLPLPAAPSEDKP